jgi:hypothetical protein
MPLTGTLSGLGARAYGLATLLFAAINDTFSRTTSGSLGTATSGQVWVAASGVWSSNAGTAITATAASSYPLALLPYNLSATISAKSVSPGAGIAFWQTSAGNYLSVINNTYKYDYVYSYTYYYYVDVCTSYYSFCSSYYTSTYGFTSCSGYASGCGSYSSQLASGTGYAGATNWYWQLSLIKAVSNVVSLITTGALQSSGSQTPNLIQSIRVVTASNGGITATAFSDTALVTSVGTLTSTQTVPTGKVSTGIILAPVGVTASGTVSSGGFNQGNSIGPFTAL